MKNFFGFGKKDKTKEQKKEETKQAMANYKGQTYNPVEDDGITTDTMFKVIDGDTGERIDVRELLGITEEDFKNNPELLNVLKHMNIKSPVEVPEENKDG